MIFVIGSGSSSISATVALVRRGFRPTILDTGLEPDASALALREKLASVEPEGWNPVDISSMKFTGPVAINGIPRKLHFGSDFSFRQIEQAPALDLVQASMYRSFAAGGFSNVWGAVIQPLPRNDFADWPFTIDELAPYYESVLRFSCATPAIADVSAFPGLRPSSQAETFYDELCKNRQRLEHIGIRFKYSKLAVRVEDRNGYKGCRYCGLCLYGCPYECRYSAADILRRLIREGAVQYISDIAVEALKPEKDIIRIFARSIADGTAVVYRANKVVLGAGLLETSKIILNSLRLYDVPFEIRHSDIFTLPLLRPGAPNSLENERLHTLCQLVVEVEDPSICSHPVHLQFYGYNDLYYSLMKQKAGVLACPLAPVLRAISKRLFVVFGYLHSGISSTMTLTLKDNGKELKVQGRRNPRADIASKRVTRMLLRNCRLIRAVPVPLQLRLDLPGGGYHSGGIFPMRRKPGPYETDRLGVLPALPGVHIVDSSILPSIPAAPTTFTVMANAYRIGSKLEVTDGR
jgi:hypothetical protein